jgi:hypothetical protein
MDNDLGSQIRELIDRGARPVSLEEASQRSAPSARRAAGLAVVFASPGPVMACRAGQRLRQGVRLSVTVTFTDSGQPQSITAPASS